MSVRRSGRAVFLSSDVTKPYEFIGFGAMDATKPHEFIGFGAQITTHNKPNRNKQAHRGDQQQHNTKTNIKRNTTNNKTTRNNQAHRGFQQTRKQNRIRQLITQTEKQVLLLKPY